MLPIQIERILIDPKRASIHAERRGAGKACWSRVRCAAKMLRRQNLATMHLVPQTDRLNVERVRDDSRGAVSMSLSKPDPKCYGTARPLRVAYLIDLPTASDQLLDEIFAEAYGRWGGRRTLIVPATVDGIDPRYDKWLYFYDADIIYNYVPLSDAGVAAIHERYGPAHLKYHGTAVPMGDAPPQCKPALPFHGLSSLSVIPALLSRPWTALDRLANPKVLSKFLDRSESPFLAENFGFLSKSFQPYPVSGYPELFTCFTLITQEAVENRQWGKDRHAEYVTSETAIFEALAEPRPLLTLASLSEVLTPYLETAERAASWRTGLSLIIGDTVEDRLLFWNGHHRYETPWFGLRQRCGSPPRKPPILISSGGLKPSLGIAR